MALPNEPITRQEMYLSNIAGQNTALPDAPITREEMYLDYIAKNGGTGEGDMKKSVYDSDNSVASAGGIKMFVNQKIGTLPQRVGSLETTAGVLEGEVAGIEDTLDTLGTASTKNSTSVVTSSSDLVESGAVKYIVGWGNKNLIGIKGGWTAQGVLSPTSKAIRSDKFAVNEGNTFIASKKSALTETWSDLYALLFDGSDNFIRQEIILENDILVGTPFTIPSGVGYVAFSVYVNGTDFAIITAFEIQVEKGPTATAYEPYHESVEETFANLGISVITQSTDVVKSGAVKDIVGWGNKNLLKYPYEDSTKTVNQVTFTDNGDGSITINGTATGGDADYKFFGAWASTKKIIPVGRYKITSNGLGDNISIIPVYNTTGYTDLDNVNAVNGLSYMILRVPNGKTVNNVTVYPMIRKADVTDATYEPYHASVEESLAEKTDNSVIAPVENGSTASQAYAVGSHAIRNGAFITWKNAKAQGETINDASDYTSGDVADELEYKGVTISNPLTGVTISGVNAYQYGRIVNFGCILTLANNISAGTALAKISVKCKGFRLFPLYDRLTYVPVNKTVYISSADGTIVPEQALDAGEYRVYGTYFENI